MRLTIEAVHNLMRVCLFQEGEPTENAVDVQGVVHGYAFHPDRIAQNAEAIGELLAELPDQFRVKSGGGWTFLNACHDKHGEQWTGVHHDMEMLFALGIAANKARWLFPRDMWEVLPGGMPYVVVD